MDKSVEQVCAMKDVQKALIARRYQVHRDSVSTAFVLQGAKGTRTVREVLYVRRAAGPEDRLRRCGCLVPTKSCNVHALLRKISLRAT